MKKGIIIFWIFTIPALWAQNLQDTEMLKNIHPKILRFESHLKCNPARFEKFLYHLKHPNSLRQKILQKKFLYEPSGIVHMAASPKWKQIGPFGGNVVGLCFNPNRTKEMYAVTYSSFTGPSIIYRSTNSGKNWKRITTVSRACFDVDMDPIDPETIYALSAYGMLKSTDRGKTWDEYPFGEYADGAYGNMCIDPVNPDNIYVAGSHMYNTSTEDTCMAILMSRDGGKTWTIEEKEATTQLGRMYFIAGDPSDPNTLYTGGSYTFGLAYYYKIYKTTNAGLTWTDITGSIIGRPEAIAIDSTNPNKIYVSTRWRIYRSSDGGNSWQKNNGYGFGTSIAVDSLNPNIIYAGHDENCYVSSDGGENWTEYTKGLYGESNKLLAVDGKVYFCSNLGIYYSKNKGKNWNNRHGGIKAMIITALQAAPSTRNIMYAGCLGRSFFRSTNFGRTWKKKSAFINCEGIDVRCVAVNPHDADNIYAVLTEGG